MKITEFWTSKTAELMPRLGAHAAAMNQVSKIYPDCVILLRAYGATRQSVVQFCNSEINGEQVKFDAGQRNELQEKVQEEMKTAHCSYDAAFSRVYRQFANSATQAKIVPSNQVGQFPYDEETLSRSPHLRGKPGFLGIRKKIGFANAEELAEAMEAKQFDGVPILGPQLRAVFRLPMNTKSAEWRAVWQANNEKPFPINFGRCMDALCEVAQNEKSLDYESALRSTKSRFPDLWATVQKMAKVVI